MSVYHKTRANVGTMRKLLNINTLGMFSRIHLTTRLRKSTVLQIELRLFVSLMRAERGHSCPARKAGSSCVVLTQQRASRKAISKFSPHCHSEVGSKRNIRTPAAFCFLRHRRRLRPREASGRSE